MYHAESLSRRGRFYDFGASHFNWDAYTYAIIHRICYSQSHALDSSPNNFHLDFRPVFLGGNSAVWNLSRTEIFSRHEDINAPDINAVNGFANVCRPVDY